jgi:hypothetical protein
MQSTGQTLTHPVSTQSMQSRVIVHGIIHPLCGHAQRTSSSGCGTSSARWFVLAADIGDLDAALG